MLRRFRNVAFDCLSAEEEAVISALLEAHQRLLVEERMADRHANMQGFLRCVEVAAAELGVQTADRGYRISFSANYRALFPDTTRRYRADVLEASADQHAAIWVNGDKFELSGEAVSQAEGLQLSVAALRAMMCRWQAGTIAPRHELVSMLEHLDAAWARFEQSYVTELIAIENKSRQLLQLAVQQEHRARHCELAQQREAQRDLVGSIARLNAVANFKRKGRDDLDAEILFRAQEVADAPTSEAQPGGVEGARAARLLARDVISAFEAMCKYLREVSQCMERVDPHLCNNSGLVERLVDWEESWEVGDRFVREPEMLAATCSCVGSLSRARRLAPALATMLESCEAELFMVLPRLLCLFFADEPQGPLAALVRRLLPHRCPGLEQVGPKIVEFAAEYSSILSALADNGLSDDRARHSAAEAAREALVCRAVAGSDASDSLQPCEEPRPGVEDLMRRLEGWSLELQRHCAEDWNQCSAVLCHCLAQQDGVKTHADDFQV
jgi:uncharacterized protein YeaO (DUF488 family)